MKILSLVAVCVLSLIAPASAGWVLVNGQLVYVQSFEPVPTVRPEPAYKAFLRESAPSAVATEPQAKPAKQAPSGPAVAAATPSPASPSPSAVQAAKLKADREASEKASKERFDAALRRVLHGE